jgi:ATP-dependent exoDNAse (exonuclease V) alpha subunit
MRSNRYIVSLDEIEVAVGLRFAKIRYDTLIDAETAVSRLIELVKTRIPRRFGLDPIREVQVLCPMNRGGVGARSLNIELQAALNPAGDRRVERFGWTFAPNSIAPAPAR